MNRGNSEKILRRGLFSWDTSGLLRRSREHLVVTFVKFVQLEDRCDIAASIAVVWCGPDRHQSLIKHLFVALHDQLVSPRDQFRAILLIENFNAILSKDVASSPRADTPALNLLRVAPHKIAHGAFVWHFLLPIDGLDLVECVNVGA